MRRWWIGGLPAAALVIAGCGGVSIAPEPVLPKALVVAIPLVAVTVGVLPALGLGLVAACLLFVVVYAQMTWCACSLPLRT